jgi:hypothetical protein
LLLILWHVHAPLAIPANSCLSIPDRHGFQ